MVIELEYDCTCLIIGFTRAIEQSIIDILIYKIPNSLNVEKFYFRFTLFVPSLYFPCRIIFY